MRDLNMNEIEAVYGAKGCKGGSKGRGTKGRGSRGCGTKGRGSKGRGSYNRGCGGYSSHSWGHSYGC